jgi:hypothetical protein
VERVEPLDIGGKAVRHIAVRLAAQGRDVEGRVIEQVFQLARELGTRFGTVSRRHALQIEIVLPFGVIVGVAGFQELEDGTLRSAAAEGVVSRWNRSLCGERRSWLSRMSSDLLGNQLPTWVGIVFRDRRS